MASSIRSLKPYQFYDFITVRICKEWPNKHYTTGRLITHDYLLVDDEVKTFTWLILSYKLFKLLWYLSLVCIKSNENLSYFLQHEAIHASVRAFDEPHITNKIKIGSIYKISNFYVDINKNEYQIVPHAGRITFARNTVFVPVVENVPDIPLNKFWFIDFEKLRARVNINKVLTGNI